MQTTATAAEPKKSEGKLFAAPRDDYEGIKLLLQNEAAREETVKENKEERINGSGEDVSKHFRNL